MSLQFHTENGKVNGRVTAFYNNSLIKAFQANYLNGGLHGPFKEIKMENSTTRIIEGHFIDSKKHGPWLEYYADTGKLICEMTFVNGVKQGPAVHYGIYDGDETTNSGNYFNNKKDGLWQSHNLSKNKLMSQAVFNENIIVQYVDFEETENNN